MLKFIFIKLVDEKLPSPKCEFRITKNEMEQLERGEGEEFIKRIESLFSEVKKRKKLIKKDYKMPHLYKDDLEEIIEILEEANFKKYEIKTDENE